MGELDRYTEASRARAAAQAAAAAERAAGDMLRYRLATEGIPIDEIPGLFHTARTLKNFSYTCYSAGVPQHRPYLGSKKPIFFGKERFIYGAEIGWGVAYGKERVYQIGRAHV